MADIVIRGIEMPKEGEKILIAAGGSVWVNVWPTRGYMRMDNVYAVPLPEGHGKIIDGDALWENMTVEQSEAFQKGLAGTIELFEMLEAAQTIVPAEGGTDNG